jgi:general transcription factor IIIA
LPTGDDAPTYFPTWSTLQSHIRTKHPATCLHPSCNGRTFANQGNLRAHLKLHEQAENEATLEPDSGNETDQPPRKKRRGGEHGRDWQCEEAECSKDFKSKKALKTHFNITHLGKRDFVCNYPNCHQAYGYKHLLRRHQVKAHQTNQSTTELSEDEDATDGGHVDTHEPMFDIEKLTGNAYAKKAEASVKNAKAISCPFPDLTGLLPGDELGATSAQPLATSSSSTLLCGYVFSRGYDLRRHLQSAHSVATQKETVDAWVRKRKHLLKTSIT